MEHGSWVQREAIWLQVFAEKELGFCEVEHVACGSGLERIYRFLQSDEHCNRPHINMNITKVCTFTAFSFLTFYSLLSKESIRNRVKQVSWQNKDAWDLLLAGCTSHHKGCAEWGG